MTSTPIEAKAQKAAIATDATWDTESQFSVENQINQDQGRSIGSTLQDILGGSKTSSSSGVTTSLPGVTASSHKDSSSAGTGITKEAQTIPTGLDAIKAAGPQSKSRTEAYSEHK